MLQMNLSNLMESHTMTTSKGFKTQSTRKRTNNNTSNKSLRSPLVVNNHSENQRLHGKKSSISESKSLKRKKSRELFLVTASLLA